MNSMKLVSLLTGSSYDNAYQKITFFQPIFKIVLSKTLNDYYII